MSKKKSILIVIAVLLLAAALLAVWYFGIKKPADMAAEKAAANVKSITVHITHTDGEEKELPLRTERSYLSELLLDEGLMEGEDQGYGLTIVSLDGEEALISNNVCWVFNVNGEMGASSVDQTVLGDGDVFDFYVLSW